MTVVTVKASGTIEAGAVVGLVQAPGFTDQRVVAYTPLDSEFVPDPLGINAKQVTDGENAQILIDGVTELYSNLTPGFPYFGSISGSGVVDYEVFRDEFRAQPAAISGAQLVRVGKAVTQNLLAVKLSPPLTTVRDSLD